MNPTAFVLLSLLSGTAAFRPGPPASPLAVGQAEAPSKLGLAREGDGFRADVGETDSALAASRRAFCARSTASLVPLLFPSASFAAEPTKMDSYDDSDYGFRLQIPSSWETTEQKLSGRRKAVFFTDPASDDPASGVVETLGFVAYTPVRDDFTTLGSFGSVDQVAQTTILPKGELAGLEDASKMLSAVSKNNAYYFDYVATPVVPAEPGSSGKMTKTLKKQHFRTIFTLLPLKNSAGMTLVTVTLQTTEERYGDVKGVFDAVVDSYGKA